MRNKGEKVVSLPRCQALSQIIIKNINHSWASATGKSFAYVISGNSYNRYFCTSTALPVCEDEQIEALSP